MKTLILSLMVTVSFVTLTKAQSLATLTVSIENIENDEGMIRVGLYNTPNSWLEEVFMGGETTIENGKGQLVFKNVPFGEYAISLYHDENNNGKLDKYLGFYPKEVYGCSNQARGNYGPPKWTDAKFTIDQNTNKQIIKL
ncbi:DUF2141 domain-containing protein [Flagellimonas flava]|uniref:Uncharacterized conserved protein, DUF2141 family n=1 Tax=Flagellimonas flava TaxID=570519 RepID=A0A1M5I1U3_9FLAO|nr:DUF2141 domain-containing protein [Allomuricauda flava]SHG22284.1 Uncharacterized conserved protein, DUF2141 family [Allomuricauda flava]